MIFDLKGCAYYFGKVVSILKPSTSKTLMAAPIMESFRLMIFYGVIPMVERIAQTFVIPNATVRAIKYFSDDFYKLISV